MRLRSASKLCNLVAVMVLLGMLITRNGLTTVSAASTMGSLPAPAQSAKSGSIRTTSLVDASPITVTEDFTTYTYKDTAHTTADWNIFEGTLRLPSLPGATRQSLPSVAVDTDGNTYVVWQDDRNDGEEYRDPDIYAQKFDLRGNRLWPADVRVNSDTQAAYQEDPVVVVDDAGNAYIVWEDHRDTFRGIYAQKLDPHGNKLWGEDRRVDDGIINAFPEEPDATLDPACGIIIVWMDWRNGNEDIYAQRLNPDGSRCWNHDVRVNTDSGTTDQSTPAVSVDAAGNAYVVWYDDREDDDDIWAQKIGPAGIRLWADLRVNSDTGGARQWSPAIATDADGYSYIVWSDDRDQTGAVYAQRLDANGNKIWRTLGEPEDKRVDSSSSEFYWPAPQVALDGSGDAFVTWRSGRYLSGGNPDVYAQRLSKDGDRLWLTDLRVNSDTGSADQDTAAIAANTDGDIRIAWWDQRDDDGDIYLQKIDIDGSKLWSSDVRVNSDVGGLSVSPAIATNSNGDSVIVWLDGRDGSLNVYTQKLDTNGHIRWRYDLRVDRTDTSVYGSIRSRPAIATNTAGTVAVVWDTSNYGDIYAQMLGPDGARVWPEDVRVNSNLSGAGYMPAVTMDMSGNLYIVWQDSFEDPVRPQIYIQKLDTAGNKLWGADRRVSTAAITSMQSNPAIAYDDQTNSLYVVWEDDRNRSSNIYAQRLNLDGMPQWSEDLRVDKNDGAAYPSVATAGGYAYVTWSGGYTSSNIYAQKLASDGRTVWSDDVPIGTGYEPAISTGANGYSYIVWEAWNDNNRDVFAQRLGPAGNKIWPTPARVNSDNGWRNQYNARISLDLDDNAYIVWQDYRDSASGVYAQKLLQSGERAWASDLRVNPSVYLDWAEARSLTVDDTVGNIAWATLTVSQTVPAGSTTTFFLSNNGGATWEEVTPRVRHTFATIGSDLRWRVVLTANGDRTETPVITRLQITHAPGEPPPNSIYVLDEHDQPIAGAEIYRNGQFIGVTDNGATLLTPDLEVGDTLVALQPIYDQPTVREAHDFDRANNLAFRIYRTSMSIIGEGEPVVYIVQGGEPHHTLRVSPNNTLILFNLVVSIEWDATPTYIEDIAHAMRLASDYLYDTSDGQMALGYIAIYDDARYWTDADIQISARNNVRPYAYVGGLIAADRAYVIRVGRHWNGRSGSQGNWDEPTGYRTLIHEFAHYALYLYDEYFQYLFREGWLVGEERSYCTGPEIAEPDTNDATNASIMDYQYHASELAVRGVPGLWSDWCEHTAQWQLNGESDWETVVRHYADTTELDRWRILTPADRGGVIPGPDAFPTDLLPFPQVEVHNKGADPPPRYLTVLDEDGQGYQGALVYLVFPNGHVIDQGFTDTQGRIVIYGAVEGTVLRVQSPDGGRWGELPVGQAPTYTLPLRPASELQAAAETINPYVTLIPSSEGSTLHLTLHGVAPGGALYALVVPPGSAPPIRTPLAYSPGTGVYSSIVSFPAPLLGSGGLHVRGLGPQGEMIAVDSNFTLLAAEGDTEEDLHTTDGNVWIHLDENSVGNRTAYAVLMPTGAVPQPLPAGRRVVGNAYSVQFSGGWVKLARPGVLKLFYHPDIIGSPTKLSIYRWNSVTNTWELMGGQVDVKQRSVTVQFDQVGIYALMSMEGLPERVFLPIVMTR